MKLCVVAIDSDVGFLERLRVRLKDIGLQGDVDLRVIEVRAGSSAEAVSYCQRRIEEIRGEVPHVDLVLVDIVIIEREETPTDRSGLEIAAALCRIVPDAPIVAMTRYNKDHRLLAEVSVDPNMDGVIPKRYLESDEFSSRDFFDLLKRAKHKAVGRALTMNATMPATALSGEKHGDKGVDLAIICALDVPEFEELLKVSQWTTATYDGDPTSYSRSSWGDDGSEGLHVVAAAQQAMGLASAAILATKMLVRWRPRYLALVGIAAGLIGEAGDILFAESAFDYASGKIDEDAKGHVSFAPAGDSLPVNATVIQWAKEALRDGSILLKIQKRYPAGRFEQRLPGLHVGPFGAGPFVVSSPKTLSALSARQRKLIALDMESYAVLRAAQEYHGGHTRALVVKAASDRGAKKSDEHQGRAAFFAAQFLYEFAREYLVRDKSLLA